MSRNATSLNIVNFPPAPEVEHDNSPEQIKLLKNRIKLLETQLQTSINERIQELYDIEGKHAIELQKKDAQIAEQADIIRVQDIGLNYYREKVRKTVKVYSRDTLVPVKKEM